MSNTEDMELRTYKTIIKDFMQSIQMLHQIHYIQQIRSCKDIFKLYKLINRVQVCVFKYLLNATSNSAFSFFRLVSLHGRLLKILISA